MLQDRKKETHRPASEAEAGIDFDAIDQLIEGVLGARPGSDDASDTSSSTQETERDETPDRLIAQESHAFGTLAVIAAPDRLKASLRLEVRDWNALNWKAILEILERRAPKLRIDRMAAEKGLKKALKKRVAPCSLEIASGSLPVKGQPARIAYLFEQTAGADARQVWASFDLLPDVLGVSDMERLVESDSLAYLTAPGEILAAKTPAGGGRPGEDIFGEPIPPEPGEDKGLKAGENVAASEDGLRLTAEISGYLRIRGDEISVQSPVCVSKDGQEAYFLNLRRASGGGAVGRDGIAALLETAGVVHGVMDVRAERIGEEGTEEARAVLVAMGSEPRPGADARLNFAVDIEARHGTVLEDGSIDFRQRNSAANVNAGDLIVACTCATQGRPGRTVTGEPVPVADGEDRRLVPGRNVRMEAEEAKDRLYAEINGRVVVEHNTVHVQPVLDIWGDVDYSVGNIDFSGDVNIGGTVRPGFSVKARGGITVRGHVEGGARIHAGGAVAVRGGILGQDTRVISGASVMAKFVQEAQIQAEEEVVVGSYIFNARVVGRRLKVEGRGAVKGGAVVGGVVWGIERIETRSAGSALTANTTLVAGRDLKVEERLKQTESDLALCASGLLNIARDLGVPDLTEKSIRRALNGAPAGRRDFLQGCLKKLKGLTEAQEQLVQKRNRLRDAVEEVAKVAQIQVIQTVFSGTMIRLGQAERRLSEDIERVTFKRVDGRIVW